MAVKLHDVVIVGSGASGSCIAQQLTNAGMCVSLLEAGLPTTKKDFLAPNHRNITSYEEVPPHVHQRHPMQAACYACREPLDRWFVDDSDEPYIQDAPYSWIRMRGLSGRLLAWEGQSYRLSDLDFKARSHDGYGEDWPLCYRDLAPYYEAAEQLIGVAGRCEGLPQLPDGAFLDVSNVNLTCELLSVGTDPAIGQLVTPARLATAQFQALDRVSRAAMRTEANLDKIYTPNGILAQALSSGNLTLLTNVSAYRVVEKDGTAQSVLYVDKASGAHREVRGRVVVLAASTLESTRILLNSGICNSSGVLGHYLTDHMFGSGAVGVTQVSRIALKKGGLHRHRAYIPRFRNVKEPSTRNFIRGYGLQCQTVAADARDLQTGSDDAPVVAHVFASAFCEALARFTNRVELASETDRWGVPVPRIRSYWSSNEIALAQDATEEAAAMLERAGLKEVMKITHRSSPGLSIHEVGTARMGKNHRTSVLNANCQSHDIPNLFVTDGACWTSAACQNPTLTIMAISLRAADYIRANFAPICQGATA